MAKNYIFSGIRTRNNEAENMAFAVLAGWTPKKKDPILHPEKDGKKEWAENSVHIGEAAHELWEVYAPDQADNTDTPFVTIVGFNAVGKQLMQFAPGAHILTAGEMTQSSYTKRSDGSTAYSYRQTVSAVQNLDNPTLNRFCAFTNRAWKDKTFPVVALLPVEVETVGKLGENNGRKYLFVTCKVAMDPKEILDRAMGTWSKDKEYYKSGKLTVVFSGVAAENRAKTLAPGQILIVTGTVEKNVYNGKEYCRIRCDRAYAAKNNSEAGNETSAASNTNHAESAAAPANAASANDTSAPSYPEEPDTPPMDYADLGDEDDELPF